MLIHSCVRRESSISFVNIQNIFYFCNVREYNLFIIVTIYVVCFNGCVCCIPVIILYICSVREDNFFHNCNYIYYEFLTGMVKSYPLLFCIFAVSVRIIIFHDNLNKKTFLSIFNGCADSIPVIIFYL